MIGFYRGKDHVGHHHEDDFDASFNLVRQREKKAQEREQNDLVTQVKSLELDLWRELDNFVMEILMWTMKL